jgi:hypothetical protein
MKRPMLEEDDVASFSIRYAEQPADLEVEAKLHFSKYQGLQPLYLPSWPRSIRRLSRSWPTSLAGLH